MTRSQSRKTAAARKVVAVSFSLSVDMNATSAANEQMSAVASMRLMLSAQ